VVKEELDCKLWEMLAIYIDLQQTLLAEVFSARTIPVLELMRSGSFYQNFGTS
jgi:hypothetical protein